MRILFLSHYFVPESNAPAVRVFELARRWVDAGEEVTVITGVPNVPDGVIYGGYRNRLRQEETIEGIRTLRVFTYIAPNRGTFRRSLNYLSYMVSGGLAALLVRRPDVVVATSPQLLCGWAGAIAGRLRRVPFVLEIRDLWPESVEAVGAVKNAAALRWLQWMEGRLYAAAHHIVTVGDGYRQRLLDKGVRADKVSVIANGIDRRLFYPRERDEEIRQRYGLKGCFVCAYIGTIGMAAGLAVVLRAARKLRRDGRRDVKFLLVGDGAAKAELESEARAAGLDNVVFAGRQPRDEVVRFYAASDASLVHLRRAAAFKAVLPSKIFESAAMACPIVLGVEGAAAALIRACGGGVCIAPEDEDELLAALERLKREPEAAKAAGRRGREYMLTHFDRDRLAERYLDVIRHTLGKRAVGESRR